MQDNEIWDRVEALRSVHPSLQAGHLPLDLVTFVDLDLGLDLIPYDGLARFGADAAVLADFSGFYVDRETFDMIDTAPEWKLNRLRFSLAHELGHWVLHQEVFHSAGIDSTDHFLEWLNRHNGRKYMLEREANEFAGRLLVPCEVLAQDFEKTARAFDAALGRHIWLRDESLRQKTCERMAPKFGVHWQTIATRFDREGVWPSPF